MAQSARPMLRCSNAAANPLQATAPLVPSRFFVYAKGRVSHAKP